MSDEHKEPRLSLPLSEQPPPANTPCDPILLLGLSSTPKYLDDVYRNDLVYSRRSQLKRSLSRKLEDRALLHIVEFLDVKELMKLSAHYKGTVVMSEDYLYENEGVLHQMMMETLYNKQRRFQAIVVSDEMLSSNEVVRMFVQMQHQELGVNVVVMAIHGCSLDFAAECFGVFWDMVSYSRQTFRLTKVGEQVLGAYAFPFPSTYCKSHFVSGEGQELFEELPEDETNASTGNSRSSGSAVIVYNNRGRCASYFGFINPYDVSYGAIVLRLCYADQYTTSDE
jgi:hypothetical protein